MSDFAERPFVAGSLIGLRAFHVDRLGRLAGPHFTSAVFTPGENEARCLKSTSTVTSFFSIPTGMVLRHTPMGVEVVPAPSGGGEKVDVEEPEHVVAGMTCQCGFYAYFDGSNDYRDPSRVSGLIEGYGVCTTGSRGFRASKARIVALITPKRFPGPSWERVVRNYPDVPIYFRKRDALGGIL